MPEIDLEALIAKAEEVQDDRVCMSRNWKGQYNVNLYSCNEPNGVFDVSYAECVKQIRKWGVPPKPKTLTFTLPTEYCEAVIEHFDKVGKYQFERNAGLHNAIVEALAPYQQSE